MTMGGITLLDQPTRVPAAQLHRDGPAETRRAAQGGQPHRGARKSQNMAGIIRQRAVRILDALPRNETFDWVDLVSVELTTQMLATLFDYPFEQRRQLTHWSNVAICNINAPDAIVSSEHERFAEMQEMAEAMMALWNERISAPPRYDLISMLAHGEATRDLLSRPREFMGTLLLLIVGGNDTTRNSICGGVWALNKHPDEYRKLRENPGLVSSLVPEIIRWQTPGPVHAPHRDRGCRARRKAHPGRRQGRDVVCLGQPGRDRDRSCGRVHHRPRAVHASIYRLVSASIAVSVTGWRSCSSPSCGRKS